MHEDKPVLAHEVNDEHQVEEEPHDLKDIQNIEPVADECQVSIDLVAKLRVIRSQLLLVLDVRHQHWPHVPVLQDRE